MAETSWQEKLRQAMEACRRDHGAESPVSIGLDDARLLSQRVGCSLREVEIAALKARVMPLRYRRNLGTVGWEGQIRLLESCVAVIGVGGLGGWVAEGLARMGVGRLILIDGDRFQEDNLNRQLGCTEATLGRPKVEALAERLAEVNSAVEVEPRACFVTETSAPELLLGAEVAVDALDSLPARFVLHSAAAELELPVVHGAIGGYTGQVMTIFPGDAGLRALYGDREVPERGVETELGNPSATPMMVSAWQIHEVVKILLGRGELLRHRLLLLDAEAGEVTEIKLG